MSDNKTQATAQSTTAFIDMIEHPTRRSDAAKLGAMFRDLTGWTPQMWGASIVGYGSYNYTYESGRSGRSLATGFSPRKTNLSIYIMPGYADFSVILVRLGKHKIGKACLYINKLDDIDMIVLKELVQAGLEGLDGIWPVQPS